MAIAAQELSQALRIRFKRQFRNRGLALGALPVALNGLPLKIARIGIISHFAFSL